MVARGGQVHDPVGNEWAGREGAKHARLVYPLGHQASDVCRINLAQAAIALVGIAVPIGQPVVVVVVGAKQACLVHGERRTRGQDQAGGQQRASEQYAEGLPHCAQAAPCRAGSTA